MAFNSKGNKSSKIAAFAAVFSLFSAANAVEWGGLISVGEKLKNGQGEKITDFDTNTSETTADAKAWIKVPFDESGENYAIAEGNYNYKYKRVQKESSKEPYLDLDLLKIALAKEISLGKISASIGRFALSDLSSLIYTQTADGVLGKLEANRFSVSVYGAYTGLLNGRTVTMLSTGDEDAYEDDTDKLYKLSERFAFASVSASFPNIIGNHSVSAEALGAFRLKGDNYTRVYGTVAANGPIVSSVFYKAAATVSYKKYGAGDISDVGYLLQGNATYYPDFKSASLGLGGTFACKKFTGFSSQTAVSGQAELQYNGVLKAGAFGTIKPVNNLLVAGSADAVCFYDTPVESGAGNSSGDFGFRGIQFGANAVFQLFSDVSFGASFTQYLDIDKATSDLSKTTFELKATITL